MASILVVDDEKLMCAILREILEASGHTVSEAAAGKAALRTYAENPTDLVITDIDMPEMDGIDFLVRVREAFPEARVVALSGGGYLGKEGTRVPPTLKGGDQMRCSWTDRDGTTLKVEVVGHFSTDWEEEGGKQ